MPTPEQVRAQQAVRARIKARIAKAGLGAVSGIVATSVSKPSQGLGCNECQETAVKSLAQSLQGGGGL